jgi:uncharacterized protein YkwD
MTVRLSLFCLLLSTVLVLVDWLPAVADNGWELEGIELAELEAIYGAPGEEVPLTDARMLLTAKLNTARDESGRSQLTRDPLAEAAAQAHASAMVDARIPGHLDAAGMKCEQRYNLLGGTDHVEEIVIYYEIDYPVYLTPKLIERMYVHWLESELHAASLLRPEHNRLGVGLAVRRGAQQTVVAGVVLFVNDYGSFDALPGRVPAGAQLRLNGRLDGDGLELAFCGIGAEPLPTPAPGWQNEVAATYSQPPVALALVPVAGGSYTPDAPYTRKALLYDHASGQFAVDITLRADAPPGLYYFTVWAWAPPGEVFPGNSGQLFRVMTQVVAVGQP